MRAASRLLASAKSVRLLEVGSPTGLTGLVAHPSPHSTLVYLYNSTLDKLKQFPENSVYRQATENLTKRRLQIVEKVKPAGFDEWQNRVEKQLAAKYAATRQIGELASHGGKFFVNIKAEATYDEDEVEWDGQEDSHELEGSRSKDERRDLRKVLGEDTAPEEDEFSRVEIDPEPRYSLEQYVHLFLTRVCLSSCGWPDNLSISWRTSRSKLCRAAMVDVTTCT
jgi:NADH dehydrogenase (ubiquinone) 1 alpha subcomplex subunit 5